MNEMYLKIILFILEYFAMWIFTVYIHEAGHYTAAKLLNLNINGFRIQKMYHIIPVPTAVNVCFNEVELKNIKMLNIKYIIVIVSGILTGAVPVSIYLMYQDSLFFTIPIGIVYLMMCSGDLTRLWKFLKGYRPHDEFTFSVTIPESPDECKSVYPNCAACAYFMVKECSGNPDEFTLIYKPTDLGRLRKVLEEKFGSEGKEVI